MIAFVLRVYFGALFISLIEAEYQIARVKDTVTKEYGIHNYRNG